MSDPIPPNQIGPDFTCQAPDNSTILHLVGSSGKLHEYLSNRGTLACFTTADKAVDFFLSVRPHLLPIIYRLTWSYLYHNMRNKFESITIDPPPIDRVPGKGMVLNVIAWNKFPTPTDSTRQPAPDMLSLEHPLALPDSPRKEDP